MPEGRPEGVFGIARLVANARNGGIEECGVLQNEQVGIENLRVFFAEHIFDMRPRGRKILGHGRYRVSQSGFFCGNIPGMYPALIHEKLFGIVEIHRSNRNAGEACMPLKCFISQSP